MSEHRATIEWSNDTGEMSYATYPRDHVWRFEHGVEVPASAAPAYRGDAARVDPEQAFVASLASCHMLTFLALAAKGGHVVERYMDDPVGHMEKNEEGAMAVTQVELHPTIAFAPGTEPDAETLATLHEKAHHHCFIANSVRTRITVAS